MSKSAAKKSQPKPVATRVEPPLKPVLKPAKMPANDANAELQKMLGAAPKAAPRKIVVAKGAPQPVPPKAEQPKAEEKPKRQADPAFVASLVESIDLGDIRDLIDEYLLALGMTAEQVKEFRDGETPEDVKSMTRIAAALAKATK
jgi:hypothetical protein